MATVSYLIVNTDDKEHEMAYVYKLLSEFERRTFKSQVFRRTWQNEAKINVNNVTLSI